MRLAVTIAVLLAVVATALVAVSQHSETRRLQHRVWQLEQRRIRLERQADRLQTAIEAIRTPRRLLVEHDIRQQPAVEPVEEVQRRTDFAPTPEIALPSGFVTGGNFEGEGR